MDLGLTGKRALVLGASRGLGAAIARVLAEEGAEVVAAARSEDKIRDWADGTDGKVTALGLDLSDAGAIDAALDDLLAEGGIDIVVNNAGGPPPGKTTDASREDWMGHFETMVANLIHVTNRVLPGMRESGWGRVVTITSSGVEQPIPNLALSNGLRSALVGWSKSLSNEVAADGITVNVVMPGRIHTQRVDELDAAASKRTGKPVEEVAAASAAAIPAGRYGRPEEFADVVAFLCSERASYVTGSKIRIDGGSIKSI
ncbi:SDR family oxidoreductase [Roseovarius sp. SCSIO 43702]|uniref:SDR family oxidoreductase n=1 Tax=Roseovarius sp. SCSIO 43702 TaxID=2823043 RepID=UPI001C739BF8|nr:SDR family oxidoreductase [Roseovarius sp. SCSIO 43702]QYX56211.1 SDR family oxidoreductase [Roseovarius sp. SCSIO 43702]